MSTDSADLPTYAQVAALPPLVSTVVPTDAIDVNGHMTITRYFARGVEATDLVCRAVGIDDDYRDARGMSYFTAEHRVRYLAELRLGEAFTVHARAVARAEKAAHLSVFLLNRARSQVSFAMEVLIIHVDLAQRRATPFPDDVAGRLDALIATTDPTGWPSDSAVRIR